ncbi:Spaetzle,Cystine-knot cytokine [Cinara cedri]|uniref:Spaetzle,Cystine-knot cytokine n=1 Tax=Cinara cedri TaxID=506608 RepID=A0A5E4M492_9HEMI|nr:Spaetzle,Cystine-knot cytokine [Cinara cedri]
MRITVKTILFWSLAAAAFTAVVVCDDLEDFPLDGESAAVNNDEDSSPDTTTGAEGDVPSFSANFDMDEEQPEESPNMADRKSDTMQKLVQSAMRKPGMKERLAQVVPIIKAMSPAQRLALAGMVMGKGQSQNLNNKILNSQLLLPISQDIATMLRNGGGGGTGDSSARASSSGYGSYHLSVPPNRLRLPNTLIRRFPQRIPEPPSMKRPYLPLHQPPTAFRQPPPGKVPELPPTAESPLDDCDLFGDNICLNVQSYPDLEIIESIEDTANSKTAFQALIKDPKYNITDSFDANLSERRSDGIHEDAICQSKVTTARPKKARSTNGQWKYVVNTEDYVQTLRLEKCLKPETRCSHVSTKFKSTCHQVYNYHRLLTWDQFSGLTMDIFKVPTCCSCHLQELNPLTTDNFEAHNSVADDQHTQSTNTNQKKVAPHKPRIQPPSTIAPQYNIAHDTISDKYPPVTRRPYKKNRTKATTQKIPIEPSESYQTTRTNYNYHPIMEYFVSPQTPSAPEVRRQDVMQRKADLMAPYNVDFQTPSGGWTPMTEEFGPRNL